MQTKVNETIAAIAGANESLRAKGQEHLDNLTKPRGSLGRLEEIALQTYMIQGTVPISVAPARIYTVAGDHGVVDEGVSLFPQEVTRQMILNFLNGGAGINVLAKTAEVDLKVVDAGAKGGPFSDHPNLIQRKVAEGTANLAKGPAMDRDTCLKALALGIDLASQAAADGMHAVGTGDMGIGNTTPSTALYCAYLGMEPETMTGAGTGLEKDAITDKARIIRTGLEANKELLATGDAIDILSAVGGLEIATLAGLILGSAAKGMMVAVDGFISTAAYTAAYHICPKVRDYCLFSHASGEQGHRKALEKLGAAPLLDLGLRLGEGTGAAMALFLLKSAGAVFNDMASFAEAGVSEGTV